MADTHNSQEGILSARNMVDWKMQLDALKIPVPPSKVIICPQEGIIRAKQRFFSKQIKGLLGRHICLDTAKGIYLSGGWGIGAPALVAVCEELRVLGATEFYLTGVCGRLINNINEADIIVAKAALREEGTSQHYLQPTANHIIECSDKVGVDHLCHLLQAQKRIFVSTDAPYRETPVKCKEWGTQNVSVIDMETSALFSFGNFYKIKTYSIGVAADSLAGGKWAMASNYRHIENRVSKLIDNLIEIIR